MWLKSDAPGLALQSFNFFRAGASNCGAVTLAGYYFHRASPCANKFRSFRAVSYCLLFLTHPIAIGSRISSDSALLSSFSGLRSSVSGHLSPVFRLPKTFPFQVILHSKKYHILLNRMPAIFCGLWFATGCRQQKFCFGRFASAETCIYTFTN